MSSLSAVMLLNDDDGDDGKTVYRRTAGLRPCCVHSR